MTTGGFNSKELLALEDELTLTVFTNKEAVELGECVIKIAREKNLPIATRVYIGDCIAFHASLPGSDAENDRWMARKVRTVAAKGYSSMCLRILAEEAGIAEQDWYVQNNLAESDHAIHGGAFPLRVDGIHVGTVVVSGIPQEDDHRLAIDSLKIYLRNFKV
jgi:uncharacterized protein (UPF0303 family)